MFDPSTPSLGARAARECDEAVATAADAKNLPLLLARLPLEFPFSFFREYILRLRVLGGLQGYCHAMVVAFGCFLRVALRVERRLGWTKATPAPLTPSGRVLREGRLPLSVFIIAGEEADRIGNALRSVYGLADDIVVVLGEESTDATAQVARNFSARVFRHHWRGYGPQKRFAEEQCRHDWLLNLDADEWLSEGLLEEIRSLFRKESRRSSGPACKAWRLPCTEIYWGEEGPRRWRRPWRITRLYERRHARFNDRLFAEEVKSDVTPGALRHPLYHRSLRSLIALVDKGDFNLNLALSERHKKLWILLARLPLEFPFSFLRMYVLRRHLLGHALGGLKGFCYAMCFAFNRFLYIARLWERERRTE